MSKAEPASGSLEDILSSIRKSLAEQSMDTLTEAPNSEPEVAMNATARREGLVGRLANATAGIADRPAVQEDDLSDVLEAEGDLPKIAVTAGVAAPAPAYEQPAVGQSAAAGKDPLWFLTRKEPEPAAPGAVAAKEAADSLPLTQPEVLRAALPPFFGASTQGPQIETVPTSSEPSAGTQAPGSRASVERGDLGRVLDPAIAREVSLVAAAVETAGRPVAPGTPLARPAAGGAEVPHALESMVLELLKPMMREWLDQNMPRLVAAALKDEADRAAAGDANAGKS